MNEALIANLTPDEMGLYLELEAVPALKVAKVLADTVGDLTASVAHLEGELEVMEHTINPVDWSNACHDLEAVKKALTKQCEGLAEDHPLCVLQRNLASAISQVTDLVE
ncbi:hypothetical protein [Candidatus Sororendozoicomonas aggregata]|uniref:hypothetical protein n=1 Tax=Candidatus Sororendozoicomonas aggregata TaxID=3073239 RepID=UPI002ED01055